MTRHEASARVGKDDGGVCVNGASEKSAREGGCWNAQEVGADGGSGDEGGNAASAKRRKGYQKGF